MTRCATFTTCPNASAAHPAATVVAVSHADVIRAALAACVGLHIDLAQRLDVHTASLSEVGLDGDCVRVGRVNDAGPPGLTRHPGRMCTGGGWRARRTDARWVDWKARHDPERLTASSPRAMLSARRSAPCGYALPASKRHAQRRITRSWIFLQDSLVADAGCAPVTCTDRRHGLVQRDASCDTTRRFDRPRRSDSASHATSRARPHAVPAILARRREVAEESSSSRRRRASAQRARRA